jgi:hypothetical protein
MSKPENESVKEIYGVVSGGSSIAGIAIEALGTIRGISTKIGRVEVSEDGKYKLKIGKKYRGYKGAVEIRLIDANEAASNYINSQGKPTDLPEEQSQSKGSAKKIEANFSVPNGPKPTPAPPQSLKIAEPVARQSNGGSANAPTAQGPSTTAAVTGIIDNVGISTGRVPARGFTDDTAPEITGTFGGRVAGAALGVGESIEIYDGETLLGIAVVVVSQGGQSTWSYQEQRALSNGQSVRYTARVRGADGSLSAPGNPYTATVDTIGPTVKTSAEASSLATGETTLITFLLSEPSTNFSLNSITTTGGNLSNFWGSGTTYYATLTADGTGIATILINQGGCVDIAGNQNFDQPAVIFAAPQAQLFIVVDGNIAFKDDNNNGGLDPNEQSIALLDATSFGSWLTSINADFASQETQVRFTGAPAFAVDLSGFDVNDRIVVDMSNKPWLGVSLLSNTQKVQVNVEVTPLAPPFRTTKTIAPAPPAAWNRFSSATGSTLARGVELYMHPASQTAPTQVNRLFVGKTIHAGTNGNLVFSGRLAVSTRHAVRNGVSGRGSSGTIAVLPANPNISYLLPII